METHSERTTSLDCPATAAVLRSGSSIALAGYTSAIAALLPLSKGGPAAWIALGSLLVWSAGVHLAIRVNIDARFFEILAIHPAGELDRFLEETGLRKNVPPRTISERRRGALRLWRALVSVVAVQIALLLLAVVYWLA